MEQLTGTRIVRPRDLPLLYEQEFLGRFLREFDVDVVFDVGANSGQYAQMLRKRAGYCGHIISFEPIPRLADRLRAQVRHDKRWHVEQVALDSTPGIASFHVMARDEFSSLLFPADELAESIRDKNSIASQIQVQVDTVADAFLRYQQLFSFERPFLKMDTQGNDLIVVLGAGDVLQSFVGLQSELAVRLLYSGSPRFPEVIATYESLGFEVSAFFPNNTGNFPDMLEFDCVMYRRGLQRQGTDV